MSETATLPTRVLIVDDDVAVLEGLRRGLGRIAKDWELSFAQDGGEALMAAKMRPVDVLITDIRMPRMHGVDLLSRFAERYPWVLRVAFSDKFDALTTYALTRCSHRYIAKPCPAETLYETVSGWVTDHRGRLDRAENLAQG